MIIKVSQSLISTIKASRLNDWCEEVQDNDIFLKIREMLVADNIVNANANINFKVIHDKFQGIIIPDLKEVVHFCQMTRINGVPRSRNTFLSQNFVVTSDLADNLHYSVSVSLNPYDLGKQTTIAPFIANTIRELLTLGVVINNSLNRLGNFEGFNDINDFLQSRQTLRDRNTGNKSTLFQINNLTNSITVYGRLDGANGKNTILACKIIRTLASENTVKNFYDVTPNDFFFSSSISKIKELGFIINSTTYNEQELIKRFSHHKVNNLHDILPRDQDTFKANIIRKYLANQNFDIHKCMASNYRIESNFIASHIHRYVDILEEFKRHEITAACAAHLIVSGDNGFLLCPNQDKEFEKGQIYFDVETKKFVANKAKLSALEFEQVSNSIDCESFKNVEFTEEFISNVKKHQKRIGL